MTRFRLPSLSNARKLTAFRRSQSGATAVEFGLLALPFLFLMFAILEIAMVFWSTQVLETAVANASRQIYTGQFQGASGNQNKTAAELRANFKTALCANVTALFNCNNVSVDIRNVSDQDGFASAAPPSVTSRTPDGATIFDTGTFTYQTVSAKKIALITAAMEYPVIVPMLKVGGLSNGNRIIMATAAFRTEPYTP